VIGDELKIAKFNEENKKNVLTDVSNLDTLSFTSASITDLIQKSGSNLFVNLTAVDENNNAYEWYDGLYNSYLIQNPGEDVIQYADATSGKIQIGDKIYVYDKILNSMKYLTITNITFEIKDLSTYTIRLEEERREYFMELSENLFLVQHNLDQCQPVCGSPGRYFCFNTYCENCGKLAAARDCLNCGGNYGLQYCYGFTD
jgi:hypothetical protein